MMKKLFFTLITLLIANGLFAQTDNYKVVIDKFQTDYNAGKYEDIFNSFASVMKEALPLENTIQFLTALKSQVGNMESKEFFRHKMQTYASYKSKFEKAVLEVNISLDKENLINGLFFKPYDEPKETVPAFVHELSSYPEELAGIIFAKTRDLPEKTQLPIAIIRDGETAYYGIIRENDTIKTAENQNRIFEIGSISKVFTSAVLASLVEDGEIKLTGLINDFYPFPFKDNTEISFQSLANHTSGLPRLPQNLDLSNQIDPYKDYGKKEIDQYLEQWLKLENEPAKVSSYSNLGVGLLGYTLGLSQKTSFQQLLQKRIFDKYGMTNSYTTSRDLGDKLVRGMDENGDITGNWDFDVFFAAGGILSSAKDLSKFVYAQFNPGNKELALMRKPTFEINETMKMGLGWFIVKSGTGKDVHWHNGGTGGYSSSMAVNVEEQTGVIILSNVAGINGIIDALCFELLPR